MYKVYGSRRNQGNRSFRVNWCLEELGMDYEVVETMPRSDEMFAVNPLGQAPTMQDGDHMLTDSVAILNHLSAKAGAMTHPAGTPERALIDARINFLITELEAPIWLLVRHVILRPKEARTPGVPDITLADFAFAETRFETLLGSGEFFAGDTFTIADIIAGHTLHWAECAKIPLQTDAARGYLANMRARPAWTRALGDTA